MTYPFACIDDNLTVTTEGLLQLAGCTVPRCVGSATAGAAGGPLTMATTLPGQQLQDVQVSWTCDDLIDQMVVIRVQRGTRHWITSNPNAIQFRDRWSRAINATPDPPVTTSLYNGQCGSAVDMGTNSTAEPNPGVQWVWMGGCSVDEWVGPLSRGDILRVHYRCYVWNPPPYSDNANLNSPQHEAYVGPTTVQLISFPTEGNLVMG